MLWNEVYRDNQIIISLMSQTCISPHLIGLHRSQFVFCAHSTCVSIYRKTRPYKLLRQNSQPCILIDVPLFMALKSPIMWFFKLIIYLLMVINDTTVAFVFGQYVVTSYKSYNCLILLVRELLHFFLKTKFCFGLPDISSTL